jgi:hypothetical protein
VRSARRSAYLVGVPRYTNRDDLDISAVSRDLHDLETVLRDSGYTVTVRGIDGDPASTGKGGIRSLLDEAIREAGQGDTVLLYFSGHGLHYQGKDCLVPSDADFRYSDTLADYLLPLDTFSASVAQSKAETIIFFIDACREGVKLGVKSGVQNVGWTEMDITWAKRRGFALIFGCGPGEFCHYVEGPQGFSLFTAALSRALSPRHPASTLGEVLDAVTDELARLAKEHAKPNQEARLVAEDGGESELRNRVICEGSGKVWRDAVMESALFAALPDHIRGEVVRLVTASTLQWARAVEAIPGDPWRDESFPGRVVTALDALIAGRNKQKSMALGINEKALLLIAPFLREAAYAAAQAKLAAEEPLSLAERPQPSRLRERLQRVQRATPQLVRKARVLEALGVPEGKNPLTHWLVHQTLLRAPEVWLPDPDGALPRELIEALATPDSPSPLLKDLFRADRLLTLARAVASDPKQIATEERLPRSESIGTGSDEEEIRPKLLAYLLSLAGHLAIDVRLLGDVVVSQLGISGDPLEPAQVLETLRPFLWKRKGGWRELTAVCPHPALHLALEDHTAHAEGVLVTLQEAAPTYSSLEPLAELPTRLSAGGLTAVRRSSGSAAYTKPLLRFELDHDRVRELLMGEALYGDPTLAFRELYQNALDACRYRQARHTYLERIGQIAPNGFAWEGCIRFRQGRDEDGREFVECEDNGVGMGLPEITGCFSRAGRRFTDLPEYIEEEVDWLNCQPPVLLYPNSQFGIGVFSYFMVADEVQVTTCRVDRKGLPGATYEVTVPGSTGIFRIREVEQQRAGGTVVRLYLARSDYKGEPVSCLATLRRLLCLAEFRTDAEHEGEREIWLPGQLRNPVYEAARYWPTGCADLWWQCLPPRSSPGDRTEGVAEVLADGIRVRASIPRENAAMLHRSFYDDPHILVVNLRNEHRPELTADRNKIVGVNMGWVRDELVQSPGTPETWQGLDLAWLCLLAKERPAVALRVSEKLEATRWTFPSDGVPLAERGVTPVDHELASFSDPKMGGIPGWIRTSRSNRAGVSRLVLYRFFILRDQLTSSQSRSYLSKLPRPPRPTCTSREALMAAIALELMEVENDRVSIGDLLTTAFTLDVEPSELRTALPLLATLAHLPDSAQIERALAVTRDDNLLLTTYLQQKRVEGREGRAELLSVLFAVAQSVEQPVRAVWVRMKQLAPVLELELPDVDLAVLEGISRQDLILLSQDLDGKFPFLEGPVQPSHVFRATLALKTPVREVWARLKRLAPLQGLELPDVDANLLALEEISEQDLILLSHLDGQISSVEGPVRLGHVLGAALALKTPVREVWARLKRLAPLQGLELPDVDANLLMLEEISEQDLILMSRDLDGRAPFLEGPVRPSHLLRAALALKTPVRDVWARLKRLAPVLELELPDIDASLLALEEISEEDLILVSLDLDGRAPFLEGPVRPSHLLRAALALKTPVRDVWARLKRLAPVLELELPDIDANLLALEEIFEQDLILVSRDLDGRAPFLEGPVRPSHVLGAALALKKPVKEVWARLKRLAPVLELEVPEVDADLSALEEISEQDLALLSRDLDGEPPFLSDAISEDYLIRASMQLLVPPDELLTRREIKQERRST